MIRGLKRAVGFWGPLGFAAASVLAARRLIHAVLMAHRQSRLARSAALLLPTGHRADEMAVLDGSGHETSLFVLRGDRRTRASRLRPRT